MSTEVIIPKLGFSVDEAVLAEWVVSDGGEVKEGDVLFLIESEKATQEVESPASGKLKIQADVGVSYQVGTVIGLIE